MLSELLTKRLEALTLQHLRSPSIRQRVIEMVPKVEEVVVYERYSPEEDILGPRVYLKDNITEEEYLSLLSEVCAELARQLLVLMLRTKDVKKKRVITHNGMMYDLAQHRGKYIILDTKLGKHYILPALIYTLLGRHDAFQGSTGSSQRQRVCEDEEHVDDVC